MMRLRRYLIYFMILTIPGFKVMASDLVRVSPITSRIVMLHFDDGHIDYYGYHQDRGSNRIYHHPLQLEEAESVRNYTIISNDDPAFHSALSPLQILRKSKGTDFNEPIWGDPEKIEFILEHHIYLTFPEPLKQGYTYTIKIAEEVGSTLGEITFLYNEATMRSEAIHVNQLGFTPDQVKYAYLSQWMGSRLDLEEVDGSLSLDNYEGARFFIVPEGQRSIAEARYSGTIAKRKDKDSPETTHKDYAPTFNYTHADVWECDFSAFNTPGSYVVVVEGMGCSYPFEIAEDVYREAYYHASRGLFYQRQGIAKEIYENLVWPRDHHPDDITHYYVDDVVDPKHVGASTDLTGYSVVNDIWGYYHDAGDWDRVVGHDLIPMVLMALYEMQPGNFKDGDIRNRYKLANYDAEYIEEGKNGIPDLLDEARWLIDFSRRARIAAMDQGLGSGGVPGGYMGREGAAGGKPSWEDTRTSAVSAESPTATYNFAGSAAWYGTILQSLGLPSEDYQPWIDDAIAAYEWAEANGGGDREAHVYASVCLYKATGEQSYQDYFIDHYTGGGTIFSAPAHWEQSAWVYMSLPADFPGLDVNFQQGTVRGDIVKAANNLVNPSEDRGFRIGLPENRTFNLGSHNTPRVQVLAMAYEITGEQEYLDCIHHTVSYTLGGNEMNMVSMTRVGDQPEKFVFHPDSWLSIDYNSRVYTNPVVDGMLSYFGNTVGWVGGVGDELWSQTSLFPPDFTDWPKAEGRIPNRNSIAGSEFTVSQNNVQAIFAYGYVAGTSDGQYIKNEPPAVAITAPTHGKQLAAGSDVTIEVTVSEDTRKVSYYAEEHYLGTSMEAPYSFTWYSIPAGNYEITALAFDDKGRISEPSEEGKIRIEAGNFEEVAVEGITIENCPGEPLSLLSSYRLYGSIFPLEAANKSVIWSSSDSSVVKVNKSGDIFILDQGTATIQVATEEGGFTASCNIQVKEPVAVSSLNFNNCASNVVGTGQTITMSYALLPEDASDKRVVFSSSDEGVASVSEYGLVTGNSSGEAIITIETPGGQFSDACTVTVLETNLPPTINPVNDTSVLMDATPFTIKLSGISDGNTEAQQLSISVSSSKRLIIPDPEISYVQGSSTATLLIAPNPGVFGRSKITLLLEDDGGTEFGGQDMRQTEFNISVVSSFELEVPGVIQAEDYTAVKGDVDTGYSMDSDGTDYVGWFSGGEQLHYDLAAVEEGVYDVTLRVATGEESGGKVSLLADGDTLVSLEVYFTGSWLSWGEEKVRIYLSGGPMRLSLAQGSPVAINVNWLKFTRTNLPCCIESIDLQGCVDTLSQWETLQLSTEISPSDVFQPEINWISSDEKIATISPDGLLEALYPGLATIYVTGNPGSVIDSCQFTVLYPVSVKDKNVEQIRIYPNPVVDELHFESHVPFKEIQILDLHGRVLLKKDVAYLSSGKVYIGSLHKGMYLFRALTDKGIRYSLLFHNL